MIVILITILALGAAVSEAEEFNTLLWHYKCREGYCKKELITPDVSTPSCLEVCQLFCGDAGALWPKPSGHLSLGNITVHLDPAKVEFKGENRGSRVGELLRRNVDLLKVNVGKMSGGRPQSDGIGMEIHVRGIEDNDRTSFSLDMSENYTLKIEQQEGQPLNATIVASTYFGARHGLETLSQLIIFDNYRNEIQVVQEARVIDGPAYPYRGVLLDTSRNFIDKATILRTIEAMGMSKLNTFHWHITDSQSFPYASRSWPKLSQYGAYSPDKIYNVDDVREIVNHGLVHGVRVLPEFDAPAHVGEGWQWVGDNATVCFNEVPWQTYCGEPPCGQLNPASDRVYEILEGIYRDMVEDFTPDIFHMGGDEVNIECWRSSPAVTDWMSKRGWNLSESNFYELWDMFQERAYEKLKIANGGRDLPAILWTSGLTWSENLHHLDPAKYIIQIWSTRSDLVIGRLIRNNFKVILSNYDTLYLDCGFSAWIGSGNNWCTPYKGWQRIYDYSPLTVVKDHGFSDAVKDLVLGGEAALWTEQVDSTSVDSRLWPRSAALAERLWAEPQSTWIQAEQRMLRHRQRLVERGILADALQPEWCLRNQGSCDS